MGVHEKVFIADDSFAARFSLRHFLSEAGHEVVSEAGNIDDALEGASLADQIGYRVAIVDGNLSEGANDCQEGKEIATEIRRSDPSVTIIAFSSSEQHEANYGDAYFRKEFSRNTNPHIEIAKYITSLPPRLSKPKQI